MIRRNRPDRHPVHPRRLLIRHRIPSILTNHHLPILRIRPQRLPSRRDETQRPFPNLIRQSTIRMRPHHLPPHLLPIKSPAARHRHQMLHQHIQWLPHRPPRLHLPAHQRIPRRRKLHQLKRMRRHPDHPAHPPRLVPAPPRPLQQPRHPLRAPHLNHLLHRRKIHPQIKAARAHHTPHRPQSQPLLHPRPLLPIQRPVMHRNVRP